MINMKGIILTCFINLRTYKLKNSKTYKPWDYLNKSAKT